MNTLKTVCKIIVITSFTLIISSCEDETEKIKKHEVRVTVFRSLFETIYALGIWVNGEEVVSKTECGSNHPTLSDEEPECFTLGWDAILFEYETTLVDGDKIDVLASTVQHVDECGELMANIYVDGNKVI